MKVFQFDGSTGEFSIVLDAISAMDVASLEDLTLQQRLDAIEGRVEVEIDQWTTPATNRSYRETAAGTWIMHATYGRMDVVIAAHPTNDMIGSSEIHSFCAQNNLLDLGEDEEVTPEMPNFVATNVEGDEAHVFWVAYFRGEPTDHDFGAAYEAIRLDEVNPALEPEKPEEQPNALSRQMGLRRYYMGQAV